PQNDRSPSRLKHFLRRCGEEVGYLDNPERKALSIIQSNHLENVVRFIGMRSDVPEMLAACKMLVWPASASHFARPIIEAGAMARPVVASDFPSSRELVQPGKTGLLFPTGDASTLAAAILRLLDNPDEASRMGEAGYVLARQRYDARVNAAATFAVYEDVLKKHSKKTP
ncbi:glycosyltransferase, partial [Patescibacteria group bacterium]|nr:glycosyltransferase [Patescibacteria group bacterium]